MQEKYDYNVTIHNNIRKLRKQKKLSQEQLAEKIDCCREHITRIENGKLNLGLENFIKLAEVFGVSLDKLAGFNVDSVREQS